MHIFSIIMMLKHKNGRQNGSAIGWIRDGGESFLVT